MSRWRPTSEELIQSLNHQPLLVVLRPREPIQAAPLLQRLETLGLVHVEIAWQSGAGWIGQCRELIASFPHLKLGAASICTVEAVASAVAAGFGYGVSPILDPALLDAARTADFTLVPGVMSPSEVHRARWLGCSIVKLFPAAPLGTDYWRRLREPLGEPLPFCIAAGGLAPHDVFPWLVGGVNAVALGSRLLERGGQLDPEPIQCLVTALQQRER